MIDAISRGLRDAGIVYTLPACAVHPGNKSMLESDGTLKCVSLPAASEAAAGAAEAHHQQQQQQDEAMFAAAAALTTINAQQS